tara:strand:- start:1236 stop:2666 length:1431 start_codon:yes stop_codon:yes gene_type:complete
MADAATSITRTLGTPTDLDKWTMSCWIKRSRLGQMEYMMQGKNAGTTFSGIRFNSDDTLDFFNRTSGTYNGQLVTTGKYRDPSAWMNIVAVWDSDNVTAGDRMKLYVNGVEPLFSTDTNPSSGQASYVASGDVFWVGANGPSSDMWNGMMSHVQFVDGAALAATEFGSFDSTSGIWKLKTSCYATPGNNGFCMKMEDPTNMDLDSSSNAHTFTTAGTLTNTLDNPSNNFSTLSCLNAVGASSSNLQPTVAMNGGNRCYNSGDLTAGNNMVMRRGKWYWELYYNAAISTRNMGITRADMWWRHDAILYPPGANLSSGTPNTICYAPQYGRCAQDDKTDTISYLSTSLTTDGSSGFHWIGYYLDMDNGKIAFTFDGALTPSATSFDLPNWADGDWSDLGAMVCARMDNISASSAYDAFFNFGSGTYGAAVLTGSEDSDWYADEGGLGKFKYNPTQTIDSVTWNARALCTKNIKLYNGI